MPAAKPKSIFACQACGFESSKWLGRCPDCGEWNSMVEERALPASAARSGAGAMAIGGRPQPYDTIDGTDAERITTGVGEFDRVLGGGIVPGSMVLIGGEPGIGKSTLLLEVAHFLGRHGGNVLYVSGEESERQIKPGRAAGGCRAVAPPQGRDLARADPERSRRLPPPSWDSVQTVHSAKLPSAPAASARCARWRRSSPSWPRGGGSRPS
jgi:DNA repair protein RadA/Sms